MTKCSAVGLCIGFLGYLTYFFSCEKHESKAGTIKNFIGLESRVSEQESTPFFSEWMDAGNVPDVPVLDGLTPLMRAAVYGQVALADRLISAGASMDARDKDGRTALHLAIINDSGVFDLLLARGARTDAIDSMGELPLHYAIRFHRHRAFEQLLLSANTEEINRANRDGLTPLLMALAAKEPFMAMRLVEAGADVNRATANGVTPLMLAASGGRRSTPELVRYLLDHGARIEDRDSMGRTALFYAVGKAWVDTTALLLEAGANYWQCDKTERTLRDYLTGEGERAARNRILAMLDATEQANK